MKYICSKANRDEVNAELRARFGDTCTRAEILQYREESGIDPRWIRKGKECSIGRGLYRIPGGTGEAPVAAPMPKMAKREKVSKNEVRSVLPTPFDDGAYDEPEAEVEVAEKPKRGKKAQPAEDKLAGRELDANGEIPAPVFVHAWICDARIEKRCPGRKPDIARSEEGAPPVCECGSTMSRHSWSISKKLF